MAPIVAEIVFVNDRKAFVLAIRENEILQPDLGGLESLMVEEAVFVEFRRADDQAADIELVEVAVGPAEGRLKRLVELGEIEGDRQLKRAADLWLDVDDMHVGQYDECVGIEGAGHG